MRASSWILGVLIVGNVLAVSLQPPVLAQGTDTEPAAADVRRGAALFSRFCLHCHEPRGPEERTDREWVIIMQHMETRANLSDERARLVRAYLLASNESARLPGSTRADLPAAPDPSALDATALDEGREVYRGAGGCIGCHGPNLEGGVLAPNLEDGNWRTIDGSLQGILDVVRNGIANSAMPAYSGGITDSMAVSVAGYVWAVSERHTEP